MPFKALGLNPLLVRAVREMGYTEPTPIQAQAIPAILAGRDLIATAQTGPARPRPSSCRSCTSSSTSPSAPPGR
jgi:ATP-dependent RNA helicase RhlE